MNQNNSKSQTTQILYREPTQEEMTTKSNWFWNFCSVFLITIIAICMALIMLRSCADEQHHNGEKHRAINAEANHERNP